MPLNDDLFEADSEADSDWQSDSKGDVSPNKKKKKSKEREDKSQDEMKKRKSKSVKVKEKPVLECENSSDSLASDSKPKKRSSDTKEETKDSKKRRREDIKDTSKKKGDKDVKKKLKEESKHLHKRKYSVLQLNAESSILNDSIFRSASKKNVDLDSDSCEEKHRLSPEKDHVEEESVSSVSIAEKQPDSSSSSDDSFEVQVKRKKKKHKKLEELEESRKVDARDMHLEKKNTLKKHKVPEKIKVTTELECKKTAMPTPVQKGSKPYIEDRGRKSIDLSGEGSNHTKLKTKESKVGHALAREVPQKPTVADSEEKNTNWRVEEKMKERPSVHTVGEGLFEKFILDTECNQGGSTVSKKSVCKSEQNTENTLKERSMFSKVI